MIWTKLLYAALLIGLAIFYVLYVDSFAFILLLCALILPLLLLSSLIWLRFTASAELHCTMQTCQENIAIPVQLITESRCLLPFPRVNAIISVRHSLEQTTQKIRFCLPLQPSNTTSMTFYLRGSYCGEITARLEKLYVRDMLHLFHINLPCRCREASVIILPECCELPIDLSASPMDAPESTEYDTVPGDDPSEILDIREYRQGDAVSRIHWKLSSKFDTLFMKEFSRPISREILLFLDYSDSSGTPSSMMQEAKGWLTTVYSISCGLLRQKQPHWISWSGNQEPIAVQINCEEDLISCFCRLYLEMTNMQTGADLLENFVSNYTFSSVTFLTNRCREDLSLILDKKCSCICKNLIVVSSALPNVPLLNTTEVFHLPPENIQSGIQRLIL